MRKCQMLLTWMEEIKLRRIPSIICKGYSGDDRADQTEFTFDLPFNNGKPKSSGYGKTRPNRYANSGIGI